MNWLPNFVTIVGIQFKNPKLHSLLVIIVTSL